MMRLTKRVLSAFLAFVMVFTMLPLESWASGVNSGSTNFGSIVEDRANTTVTLAVGDTTTVTGPQWGTWSVTEGKKVIRIVSGGNSQTVEIMGLAEGTATLELEYGIGYWTNTEEYTVTVTSGGAVSADPQIAYFYVRKPSVPDSAGYVMMWAYAGTGTITGEIGSPANAVGNSKFYEGNAADAIISAPSSYPILEYEGKTYRYSTNGEPFTYTINWSYVICSDGANDGASGTVVASGTPTWHVDGFANLVTPSKFQVNFMVQEPGQADYVIVGDALGSFVITEGDPVGQSPAMEATKYYDGIPYHFDGWYLDKECTQKVDNVRNYVPKSNVTFYGKYVPDVPKENQYSAVVNIYAGNKGTGVLIGTKTLNNITWEELTGYYKLAHYEVANRFWGETILDSNDELYTHSWDPSQADPALTQGKGNHVLDLYLKESAPGLVTITYDPNGGTNPPAAYNGVKGDTYYIAEPGDMTREGYDFAGWNTAADGSETSFEAGQEIELNEDMTLYAQWTKKLNEGDRITFEVMLGDVRVKAEEYIHLGNLNDKTEGFVPSFADPYGYVDYKYEKLDCADISLDVNNVPEGYHVESVKSDDLGPTTAEGVEPAQLDIKSTNGEKTAWALDNVPGGATVTVTLTKLSYTVNYRATAGGSVSVPQETVVYGNDGDGSTATPGDGYYFVNWTKGDEVVSTDPTFVPKKVTGNATYTAHFAKQTAITIKAGDLRKTYDGTAINADGTKYTLVGGELQDGHHIVVTTEVSAAVVNVGDPGEHRIATYHIYDNNNKDVGYLYDVTLQPGTLTIEKRNVTLTSATDSKEYDGTALTNKNVTVQGIRRHSADEQERDGRRRRLRRR